VPVLARGLEAAGFSTVVLTMMPFIAERLGCPRTVGVEFPFGHPVGRPGDHDGQMAVLRDMLRALDAATEPGRAVELPYEWPVPLEVAYRAWQPREPSPIVAYAIVQARQRREASGG
jgi:D-proline reductase (dithiol) PrdB